MKGNTEIIRKLYGPKAVSGFLHFLNFSILGTSIYKDTLTKGLIPERYVKRSIMGDIQNSKRMYSKLNPYLAEILS